jgi:hypothetical protein
VLRHERAIVVAHFNFSCTLFATFNRNSEENKLGGRKIMKIVIRAMLFATALAFAALSVPVPTPTPEPPMQATTSFSVPVPTPTPEPPSQFSSVPVPTPTPEPPVQFQAV